MYVTICSVSTVVSWTEHFKRWPTSYLSCQARFSCGPLQSGNTSPLSVPPMTPSQVNYVRCLTPLCPNNGSLRPYSWCLKVLICMWWSLARQPLTTGGTSPPCMVPSTVKDKLAARKLLPDLDDLFTLATRIIFQIWEHCSESVASHGWCTSHQQVFLSPLSLPKSPIALTPAPHQFHSSIVIYPLPERTDMDFVFTVAKHIVLFCPAKGRAHPREES